VTHQLAFAARSDRGLIRSSNQDSVYAGNNMLVVADGMGGHAAGDMASRLVVAAFVPLDSRDSGGDLLRDFRSSTCRNRVCRRRRTGHRTGLPRAGSSRHGH